MEVHTTVSVDLPATRGLNLDSHSPVNVQTQSVCSLMEIFPTLWVLESFVKITSSPGNYIGTVCLSAVSLEESRCDLTLAVGWHTCN